mmetsp:Transcript_20786/g.64947  ORF Transcript_20786/g.64947 Transcript_20786/m.64947 type:complete len:101 (-) Transcript_20786:41-343(-)
MAGTVRTGDKFTGHTAELGTYVRIKIPRRECICWDDYEEVQAAPKPAAAMTSALGGIDLKSHQAFPTTMDRMPPRPAAARPSADGIAPFPAETVLRHGSP